MLVKKSIRNKKIKDAIKEMAKDYRENGYWWFGRDEDVSKKG